LSSLDLEYKPLRHLPDADRKIATEFSDELAARNLSVKKNMTDGEVMQIFR